jgi:hypothetical protein
MRKYNRRMEHRNMRTRDWREASRVLTESRRHSLSVHQERNTEIFN